MGIIPNIMGHVVSSARSVNQWSRTELPAFQPMMLFDWTSLRTSSEPRAAEVVSQYWTGSSRWHWGECWIDKTSLVSRRAPLTFFHQWIIAGEALTSRCLGRQLGKGLKRFIIITVAKIVFIQLINYYTSRWRPHLMIYLQDTFLIFKMIWSFYQKYILIYRRCRRLRRVDCIRLLKRMHVCYENERELHPLNRKRWEVWVNSLIVHECTQKSYKEWNNNNV